jgi:hypothetical protein
MEPAPGHNARGLGGSAALKALAVCDSADAVAEYASEIDPEFAAPPAVEEISSRDPADHWPNASSIGLAR